MILVNTLFGLYLNHSQAVSQVPHNFIEPWYADIKVVVLVWCDFILPFLSY